MAPWTITVSQAQSLAAVSRDKDLSLASSRIYELLSLRRNMVGKQRLACVCVSNVFVSHKFLQHFR